MAAANSIEGALSISAPVPTTEAELRSALRSAVTLNAARAIPIVDALISRAEAEAESMDWVDEADSTSQIAAGMLVDYADSIAVALAKMPGADPNIIDAGPKAYEILALCQLLDGEMWRRVNEDEPVYALPPWAGGVLAQARERLAGLQL